MEVWAVTARMAAYPEGIVSLSPGLRVSELPWATESRRPTNPEGVVSAPSRRCG